jgi:hypothetical protein
MHSIELQEMSEVFLQLWQQAGAHLVAQAHGEPISWLRGHPNPPYLEHLSFRIGNQLFFIRAEDVERKVEGPGSLRGLLMVADGNNGHACLLPMRKKWLGGAWVPDRPGWGLVEARTNAPVDPWSLVTDEKIEMTRWESHDMAVQVVRDHLKKRGYQIMSWQGNPDVDPAIWFIGDSRAPEWVVVRQVRYPDAKAARPEDWDAIRTGCEGLGKMGHFASVSIANADQRFPSHDGRTIPLWRGHGMHIRFDGLE